MSLSITGFRLSPQQRQLWEQQGSGPSFHVAAEVRLERAPSEEALIAACRRLAERYEILRTLFPTPQGMLVPVQQIGGDSVAEVSTADLSAVPGAERTTRAAALFDELRQTPFDLAAGPPLRLRRLTMGDGSERLQVVVSGLCADAVSLDLLLEELTADLFPGGKAEAREEVLQYADAAEIFNDLLEAEDAESGRAFWRRVDRVTGLAARLPTGGGELAARRDALPQAVPVDLPDVARATLERFAAERGVSSFLVYLTAWLELLGRLTGGSEHTVGVRLPGRDYEGLEDALGLFSRRLPLVRSGRRRDRDLAAAATALGDEVAELVAHQDFFDLSSLSGVDPETLSWPFGFTVRPAPRPLSPASGGCEILARAVYLDRCHLELEAGDGVSPRLLFDPHHSTREHAERVAGWLSTLLAGLAAESGSPPSHLALVAAAFRERWRSWNAEAARAVPETTVDRRLDERVTLHPARPAVLCGTRTLSFADLGRRVAAAGGRLAAAGVGPETRVAVLGRREPDLLVALLGVLRAGGAYVPLDPDHPPARLRFLLEDSGASLVLVGEGLDERLTDVPAGVERKPLGAIAAAPRPGEEGIAAEEERARLDGLAYVLYTSGSTGRPKGVMVEHRSLANYLAWCLEAYGPESGAGSPVHTSIGFDLTVTSLFAPLLGGRPVTLLPESDGVGSLVESLRGRPGYGFVKLTPSHVEVLEHALADDELAGIAHSLVVGGEALFGERLAAWRERAPQMRIVNEYGPTEAVVGCTAFAAPAAAIGEGAVPIGRPVANARVYLLDDERLAVPDGVVGELYVGGAGLARGYQGRPGLTAERFVPGVEGEPPGSRSYRTGDLARRRDDGELEYLGRNDEQLKIRGFRVEPGEVEAALLALPEVRQAAVVGRTDGTGGARLVAYVVPADAGNSVDRSVLGRLRERLPEHLVPTGLVCLPALPLTPHGKVDRRELPEDEPVTDPTADYAAPRTATEELLAAIWSQVLDRERVGIDDNFFNLGGDSIRSVQVVSLAQRRGVELTLDTLYQLPTIRRLAPAAGRDEPRLEAIGSKPFAGLTEEDREALPEGVIDAYPLVRLQVGMLFHSQLAPDTAVYLDQHSWRLRARFSPQLLRLAIEQEVARHPVLRTSFDLGRFSQPLQLVHDRVEVPLELHDLSGLDVVEQEAAIDDWLRDQRARTIDWSRPPLVEFACHRRGEDSFQFTVRFHHAILDGWSAASLMTQLFRRYLNLLEGARVPAEDPLGVTFRDFVALEAAVLESDEAREFWKRELEGAQAVRLPRWHGTTASRRGGSEVLHPEISPELSEALREAARELALPLKSVLLAAHLAVLRFLSGTSDVVTGIVSSGRPEVAEGERVLGLFLNTLPLRHRFEAASWRHLVEAVFEAERRQLSYRRYPLADLQRAHGGELFEVVFNFLHFHVYETVPMPEAVEVLGWRGYEEANFPLAANFAVEPESGRVRLGLNFRRDILPAEQVAAIGGYYLRALEALAEDLEAPSTASWISDGERRRFLEEWNARSDELVPATLHELFEAQVERTPEEPALIDGERMLSYRQLDRRSNHLAHALRRHGVGPESRVGIVMDRTPEMIGALLATLKAGGAYVPLDPVHPEERLRFFVEDSGCTVLLGRAGAPSLSGVTRLDLGTAWAESESGREAPPGGGAGPENLVYTIYTSGSTGTPRGVEIRHAALATRVLGMMELFGFAPGDRQFQFISPGFDVFGEELYPPLLSGAALVLHPAPAELPLPELLTLCDRLRVSKLNLMAPLWHRMVDELEAGAPLPGALELMVTGAEAPDLERIRTWVEICDRPVRMFNFYGPTEATILATTWEAPRNPAVLDGLPRPPIGRPFPAARVLILDRALDLVPVGVTGELCIGGRTLARGYRGRPAATAAGFVPDPFSPRPGGRLYRTGDLARAWPDGNLEFLGRVDRQVKIRGLRIELEEVETALRAESQVREAAVVLHTGPGGAPRLVAYMVLGEEGAEERVEGGASEVSRLSPETVAELRRSLQERLPSYMVPSLMLGIDALPLTPHDKVDRDALPDPDPADMERVGSYEPPRGGLEERLATLWSSVLDAERVGREDDFFELGGDSIVSVQLVARAHEAGLELSPRQIFEHPTVASLAAAIAVAEPRVAKRPTGGAEADLGAIEPLALVDVDQPAVQRLLATGEVEDVYPPSPVQAGMLFHTLLEPEGAMYVSQMRFLLTGELSSEAFRQAWQRVIDRHPILRTSCLWEEVDEPVLVVYREVEVPIEVRDRRAAVSAGEAAWMQDFLDRRRREGFDLARAPLLRLDVLRVDDRLHQVIWTHHHLILDGWSSGRLFAEFIAFYHAALTREAAPALPAPRLYRDYIGWIARRDSGEAEAFWQRYLAGFLDPTPLGFERGRSGGADDEPDADARYDQRGVRLPEPETRWLGDLARRHQLTLNTVVQGAWAILLWHWSDRGDLVFGTTVSTRPVELAGIEAMVGLFINTLPLRLRLAPSQPLVDWLRDVQRRHAEIREHSYVPLGQVARWSEVPQSRPLFESILVFENYPVPEIHEEEIGLALEELEFRTRNNYPLSLVVGPHAELSLKFLYECARFDRGTVDRLLAALQAVLRGFIEDFERPLEELRTIVRNAEQEERSMPTRPESSKSSVSKLKSIRRRTVSLSEEDLVDQGRLEEIHPLPWRVQPRDAGVDLGAWVESHGSELEERLLEHGGILFRGFEIDSVPAFEQLVRRMRGDLLEYTEQSTPRSQVEGRVYTSTEYPPHEFIPLHNETAYSHRWPLKIWFCCLREPTEGGMTPIADSREVYRRMPEEIRERFERDGVMYVRNYGEGLDLTWQRVFQTENRDEVEEYCREAGIELEWRGDRLRTRQTRQAVARHPKTGETVWFNQAHLFHVSSLPDDVRSALLSVYGDDEVPRNSFYGDGTPIEASVIEKIGEVYRSTAVAFPWRRGDVLLLDNMLTAHGRTPFEGERKVVVAMAQPTGVHAVEAV